ncbi:squalene synthase HpnC [Ectothiorhodospiraceae bacterium 2226]|nr:squalene synthase HpnC [Ectothiorhodospiraceae bacterium 2226]
MSAAPSGAPTADAVALEAAYRECEALARSHYENFPVASRLLPARLRRPIAVIYTFARRADDFADEGELTPAERLAALDAFGQALERLDAPREPLFVALADVVRTHQLPLQPFHDLLHAFRMDVTVTRYADLGELMHYCRHSANPVGRLLLHLFDAATPRNLGYSDAVCTALQLINFIQDVGQDLEERDRIYIPQDEMRRFGVDEAQLRARRNDFALRGLMDLQIKRARALLQAGAPLGRVLPGRVGFELRMIILGGERVLKALFERRDDVFARPRLGARDWASMLWRAALPPRGRAG